MRKTKAYPNEYYHIINRGSLKQPIFFQENDYTRFLFLILFFQSPEKFDNVSRLLTKNNDVRNSVLNIEIVEKSIRDKIIQNRYVELNSFILMPNHFHLLLREVAEGGVQKYMQRVLLSYTKSVNKKYEKSGHLFQGPYKIIHITSNEQLLYVSAYIHANATELQHWQGREDIYPWSSYQDYVYKNRWGELLKPQIILDQSGSGDQYKKYVKNSGAKNKNTDTDDERV